MSQATTQISISKKLETQIQNVAKKHGYKSINDFLKVVIEKIDELEKVFATPKKSIQLSDKAIKRYKKILDDMEIDKNTYSVHSTDEMMNILMSDDE